MNSPSTSASTMSALTTLTSSALSSSASSSTSSPGMVSKGPPPAEKLSRTNLLLWKAIVLPNIKGAQMEHYLDAATPEPPATALMTKTDGKEEPVVNSLSFYGTRNNNSF